MRNLTEYSAKEWLQLRPVQDALKQGRNDAWLAFYKRLQPNGLARFLEENANLAGKNIALVVAFEQPWALNWLLQMARKNLADATVLVFDNSRRVAARKEIEQVCKENSVPYLALPANPTRHVNRSHGMAMTWIYHNVIRVIRPRIFGFIDHDLIPVGELSFADRLAGQAYFGLLNQGKLDYWSLWAGYCLFDYAATTGRSINFLYDFSRGLDTGGRNWRNLYRPLDRRQLRFARDDEVSVKPPSMEHPRRVQLVDERWLHIGGISYNDNFRDKFEFFKGLAHALGEGGSWQQLQSCREPQADMADDAGRKAENHGSHSLS